MVYHPEYSSRAGERRSDVTHATDIAPTIYEMFGAEIPEEVTGRSLISRLEDSGEERSVIFGIYGGAIGIADGRYTYYLYPDDLSSENNLYEYTLMPEHLRNQFSIAELKDMELDGPFDFTRGVQVLKVKARDDSKRIPLDREGFLGSFQDARTILFDTIEDPGQNSPIQNPRVEERLKREIVQSMKMYDAPQELYARFNLGEYL
jgi:hypothetical protein